MARGVYIYREPAKPTPSKRESTQVGKHKKALALARQWGKHSLDALHVEIVAQFRDVRQIGDGGFRW